MLAILPVLPLDPDIRSLALPSNPRDRNEWGIARRFAGDNAGDYRKMLQLARIAGILWSLLGAFLVYQWAKQLFGKAAGFVGLSLWCFDPNILASGAMLTPDMPLTVAAFGATYLFWTYLRRPTLEAAVLCGFALGIVQLTKFTALVLYVAWPVLWLGHTVVAAFAGRRPSRGSLFAALGHGFLLFAISIGVINAGYAFDGSFSQLKDYQFTSRHLRSDSEANDSYGNRFENTLPGEVPVPLPIDYVQGIDLQRLDFEKPQKSYLAGEIRDRGWWYYYLYAFMVKVPVGTIALVLWSLVLTAFHRSCGTSWFNELTLWLPPLAIFALVSSQTGFNHHFRYVLPIFPFLFVACSRVGIYIQTRNWLLAAPVIILVAWSAVSSLLVFPHSLSYFNEPSGGPDQGYKHLIDSNIDWGQDLWFLKDWVNNNPDARPFSLAYHNYIDYKGIAHVDIPLPPADPPHDSKGVNAAHLQSVGPHAGYFAVDVHNLILGPYRYFQRFTPVAKAGYSIFIYYLSAEEADAARRDMGLPPLEGAVGGKE
jgi:4-amino-4-deoxy-L-arabinose transferase-like glycosyltransferase